MNAKLVKRKQNLSKRDGVRDSQLDDKKERKKA
jgi:hypothetical protein